MNKAPTGISLSGNTVPENTNTTGGYAVGILSGTDPDVSPPFNTLMFSLVGEAALRRSSVSIAGITWC